MIDIDAFNGKTGEWLCTVDYTDASWSDSINEDGSLSLTAVDGAQAKLKDVLKPYKTILAAKTEDGRVLHAGYIKKCSYNRLEETYSVDCGGFISILEKRLVLTEALKDWEYWNKQVMIDEENPAPEWVLKTNGSYRDIMRALVEETTKWGELPVQLEDRAGEARHEMNYQCWELSTVAQKIADIGDLEDGIEYRFDPVLSDTLGALKFKQRAALENGSHPRELVDNEWWWVVDSQGAIVNLGDEDDDGDSLASECFATGGRENDTLVVARYSSDNLINQGYPAIQVAETSHSSVGDVSTLNGYVGATVQRGDRSQKTTTLQCPLNLNVRVGDWANVGAGGSYTKYKVIDVGGSSSNDYLDIGLRERYE